MQGKRPKGNGENLNYAEKVEVAESGMHARVQTHMLERGPQSVQGISLLFSTLKRTTPRSIVRWS